MTEGCVLDCHFPSLVTAYFCESAGLGHMAEALASSDLGGVVTALFEAFEGQLQRPTGEPQSSWLLQAVCSAAPAYALTALRHNLKGASDIESLLDSLRQNLCKQVCLS